MWLGDGIEGSATIPFLVRPHLTQARGGAHLPLPSLHITSPHLGNLAAAASPPAPVALPPHPLDPQPHSRELHRICLGGTLDPNPPPDLAPNPAPPQLLSIAKEIASHGSPDHKGIKGGSKTVSFSIAAALPRIISLMWDSVMLDGATKECRPVVGEEFLTLEMNEVIVFDFGLPAYPFFCGLLYNYG